MCDYIAVGQWIAHPYSHILTFPIPSKIRRIQEKLSCPYKKAARPSRPLRWRRWWNGSSLFSPCWPFKSQVHTCQPATDRTENGQKFLQALLMFCTIGSNHERHDGCSNLHYVSSHKSDYKSNSIHFGWYHEAVSLARPRARSCLCPRTLWEEEKGGEKWVRSWGGRERGEGCTYETEAKGECVIVAHGSSVMEYFDAFTWGMRIE